MTTKPRKTIDVVAYGQALMDVQAQVPDQFLADLKLEKNMQQLVSEERASWLFNQMSKPHLCSGGSAANSMAVVAALGGKAAFLGRVGKDAMGDAFAYDLRKHGVQYQPRVRVPEDGDTGRCLIFVTPDGKRTMNTHLGATTKGGITDLDYDVVAQSKILLLEGYMFDAPGTQAGTLSAIEMAKHAGTKVAFTLSAENCIERHRPAFRELVQQVDIVLGNDDEIKALYGESYDVARERLRRDAPMAVITRGKDGADILRKREAVHVPVLPNIKVVDTTGAGDAFAGGFLFARARGHSLVMSGHIASACAGEIISHMGARPAQDLKMFVYNAGVRSRERTTRSVPVTPRKPA